MRNNSHVFWNIAFLSKEITVRIYSVARVLAFMGISFTNRKKRFLLKLTFFSQLLSKLVLTKTEANIVML